MGFIHQDVATLDVSMEYYWIKLMKVTHSLQYLSGIAFYSLNIITQSCLFCADKIT